MKVYFRFVIVLSIIFFMSNCHVARYFYWNVANVDDYKKFENTTIEPDSNSFHFQRKLQPVKLPDKYMDSEITKLSDYLSHHKSTTFIMIHNDSVIYEKYFNGYDSTSYFTSFSIAKSFVSALTGFAIATGAINSVKDKVSDYLPYIDTNKFGQLTIEHLLNMRSGIKANEGYYNPFGDVAKYYYGQNLDKYLRKLKKEAAPGQHYAYKSVNTQLLADVIEHATGTSLQNYLEKMIWRPLGMQSRALWSIDSKKHQTVKAFCCLNAKAMDYARFGRLYLNEGQWKGSQILPKAWVKRSTSIINESKDSQGYAYTYQWRVTEYGAFFAKGIKGQYIYVYPEKNMIALRFGKSYDHIDWAKFIKQIIDFNHFTE